ncbi:MAG: DUF364 domain-containing protein [Desulfobulbaceae bacterium]|nr:DUF364 domain-containing protein [Desulfobulbaceae bacterium]
MMSLVNELIAFAEPLCTKETIVDVRIGLGYTLVELADGRAGLAWTPDKNQAQSCTHMSHAGTLLDFTEKDLLMWLRDDSHLKRALGLATFNAVNSRVERVFNDQEAISQLGITETDHVAMVGHFAPLIPRIKKSGCRLEVIERNKQKEGLELVDLRENYDPLAQCDVAIITSTSIINNSVDTLLATLKNNRSAVMLGPSTPLCPEVFNATRVSQLSGAFVADVPEVKNIISQGGGTKLLKKHLNFVNHQA